MFLKDSQKRFNLKNKFRVKSTFENKMKRNGVSNLPKKFLNLPVMDHYKKMLPSVNEVFYQSQSGYSWLNQGCFMRQKAT
jgi:hypothetical protein